MALRKCPGCKNTISAETLTCPICGCNPRTRLVRKYLFWTTASVAVSVLLMGRLRQNAPDLGAAAAPTGAVAATR